MTASTMTEPRTRGRAPGASGAFRRDIQGLRAVAVVLVLLYHAGVPMVGGGFVGVDVFFVISGFLITGLILREVESTGGISLSRFYSRRARRLLPATALVFVGVTLITLLLLPVTQWRVIAGDLAASAFYVVNWRLADRSVDYLADDTAASPLQHFWSLAVEEQFYVVWPLLVLALLWWSRRAGGAVSRRRLAGGLLLIALPSLAWSVHLTTADPGRAYFVSTTRAWELALGALLAVGARRLARLPVVVRASAGWLGLLAIAVAALTFDRTVPFPGFAALLPTLGAAAVIAAGTGDGRGSTRVLTSAPMQDVGAMSYSLYLWHWPVLIAAGAVWDTRGGDLWLPTALAVVGCSVVPAWLAYRVVEQPLHAAPAFARPRLAAVLAGVCVLVGLACAGAVWVAVHRAEQQEHQRLLDAAGDHPGALVLGSDRPPADWTPAVRNPSGFVPGPLAIGEDVAGLDGEYCISTTTGDPVTCEHGPADGPVVAVVGDSKMHQWLPALSEIADRRGWHLVTYLKSACPFVDATTVDEDGKPNRPCVKANASRIDAVLDDPSIDYLLMSQVKDTACPSPDECGSPTRELMTERLTGIMRRAQASGMSPVVVADNPSPPQEMIPCVAEHLDDVDECRFTSTRTSRALTDAAHATETPVVDLNPWVCPGGTCWPVVGGVVTYRQGSHLTATFVTSLAPVLEAQLVGAGLP